MDSTNAARQTTIVVFLAFMLSTIGGGWKTSTGESTDKFHLPETRQLAAWLLLYLFLLVLADIPSVGTLSMALAWVILLSVILSYGIDVFDRMEKWVK